MKQIIRAYDVLSDPVKRKQYYLKWSQKNNKLIQNEASDNLKFHNSLESARAQTTLLNYMDYIHKQDYHSAYEMLSARDQLTIPKNDFIKWQLLVSEIFELLQYKCEVKSIAQNKTIIGNTYEKVANVEVSTIEKNHILGVNNKDQLMKNTVFENNEWSVFLGRNDLSPVITKFNDLVKIKNKQKVFSIRTKRGRYVETIPGLLHKHAFLEKARLEQERYNRYNNPFSLIICTIKEKEKNYADIRHSMNCIDDELYKQIGVIIAGSIRELDFMSRWQRRGFIILLPETNITAAIKTANRIQQLLNAKFSKSQLHHSPNNFSCDLEFKIGEQKHKTFRELYKMLTLIE